MQWSPSGYSTAVGRALPTWPARGPCWDAPGGSTSRLTVAATSGSAAAPSPASRARSLSSLSRRARGRPARRETKNVHRRDGRSPRLEAVAQTGEQKCRRSRSMPLLWTRRDSPGGSLCAAELELQLPVLDAHDVSHLVQIIHLPHDREARLLYYASALGALEGCVDHDPTHLRRFAGLSHGRLTRRSGAPAVSLRLGDGVADLERPHLVDERRTDLADDEVVFRTVEEE